MGLFHAGTLVRIDLQNGEHKTVATNLSCPEGVGVDNAGYLYTVENPIGNECRQDIRKAEAQLTRINITSGEQQKVAALKSPHGWILTTVAYTPSPIFVDAENTKSQ